MLIKDIVQLINAEDEALEQLYTDADQLRKENMGDEVFFSEVLLRYPITAKKAVITVEYAQNPIRSPDIEFLKKK